MKLDYSIIKDITCGAVNVTEEEDGYHFYRFTNEQADYYKGRDAILYARVHTNSGIKLRFKTDSNSIFLDFSITDCLARSYYSIDIFVEGKLLGQLRNYNDEDQDKDYCAIAFPQGDISASFDLGDGEKEVCIYLPWSVNAVLKELALDDGAKVVPIKSAHKLLCFGDSITQGYDALCSSGKYTTLLASMLDADEYNKGIGGDIFSADFAEYKDDINPDFITVAYGTNDWYGASKEGFKHHCTLFFEKLYRNYPDAEVYVITPIWRVDVDDIRPLGSFYELEGLIKEYSKANKNVKIISGLDIFPHSIDYFADKFVHPNDKGFKLYAENVFKKIYG